MSFSSALYWLCLIGYLSCASFLFFFTGVNWYTVETKLKQSPQKLVVVLYIVNFLVLYYAFDVHFLLQFIIKSFFMAGVYMGTHFQCIGLTGGIATGKSTVSHMLAENGFDIIDADKISKEVRYHRGIIIDQYHVIFVFKRKSYIVGQ